MNNHIEVLVRRHINNLKIFKLDFSHQIQFLICWAKMLSPKELKPNKLIFKDRPEFTPNLTPR